MSRSVGAVALLLLFACGDDVGASCRDDMECDVLCGFGVNDPAVRAATEDGAEAPLVCAEAGAGGAPGDRCAAPSECAHGLCTVAGTCVSPCATTCPGEGECALAFVRGEGERLHEVRACAPRFVLPPSVDVVASHAASFTASPSGEHTIHLFESSEEERATVRRLSDQDDVELFSRELVSPTPPPVSLVRLPVALPPSYVVAALPNGEAPAPSQWALTFDRELTTEGHSLSREAGAAPTTLDLDLFYLGLDVSPEGPRGPAPISEGVDTLAAALASAGISLGEVRQHAVGGVIGAELGIVALRTGLLADFDRIMRLGRGAPASGVPIFIVREMDFYLGVTGQVPGAHGRPGTMASGCVVCLGCSDNFPRILAHEVGHYLGLFHPTEISGVVFDSLADTPVCPASQDLNGDDLLSPDECVGHGADNLMFYDPRGGEITADQGRVMRRALVLR